MSETAPVVSVIVPSVNGLPYPLDCLAALAEQDTDVSYEVLLPDCTGPETVGAVRARYPNTRIFAYDERKSVPRLRSVGFANARGRFVAVTEDHCVPRPDWIAQMLAAHERYGWPVVAGGVQNDSPERTVDWAVFFCEYSAFLDPVVAGPSPFAPGMNVCYDMQALASMKRVFAEGMWESFLHPRLLAAGYIIGLAPEMVVGHKKEFTIRGFLAERFHYSRDFAGTRVATEPPTKRLLWALASLALPPVLLLRMLRRILPRPSLRGRFLRALPLVVLFTTTWVVGEFVGYLTGPGDSATKVR